MTGSDARRRQILGAMVALVREQGFAGVTVTAVCERAHVSRSSFYRCFVSREDCFLAIQDQGYRDASRLIDAAFAEIAPGELGLEAAANGLRGALASLLSWFDREPQLTRVWLVESLGAGSWALERRELHIAALTEQIVGHWGAPAAGAHRLAAPAAMASVMGLIHRHLVRDARQPLVTMLGPLMGVVCGLYLDERAVREQVRLGEQHARNLLSELAERQPAPERLPLRSTAGPASPPLPRALTDPRAHRLRRALLWLADHPAASNRQLAEAAGIASHAQVSALLVRLRRLGLTQNQAVGAGRENSWSLTEQGECMARRLRRCAGPARSGAHVTHRGQGALSVTS